MVDFVIINPAELVERKVITGLINRQKQIQMVSVDLTVADIQRPLSRALLTEEERHLPLFESIRPEKDNIYRLDSGCYTVIFNEGIEVPEGLAAFIIQRSSMNRSLATITASVIDPGYKAEHLGASLYIQNPHGICIEKNCRVATIYFVKSRPAKKYDGYYQNEKISLFSGNKAHKSMETKSNFPTLGSFS